MEMLGKFQDCVCTALWYEKFEKKPVFFMFLYNTIESTRYIIFYLKVLSCNCFLALKLTSSNYFRAPTVYNV